jgi:hypothetical protein
MPNPRMSAIMPLPESPAGRFDAPDELRSAQLEPGGVAVEHCRVWLKWAAAHVDECLTRDSLASSDLLAALAEVLGPAQSPSQTAPAAHAGDGKMSAVVIAVQSHDRVMQGLAHLADSLRGLHAQLSDTRRADSAESWGTLRETQFRAFSMAQERALFARMVGEEQDVRGAEVEPDETIELFTGDDGLFEP